MTTKLTTLDTFTAKLTKLAQAKNESIFDMQTLNFNPAEQVSLNLIMFNKQAHHYGDDVINFFSVADTIAYLKRSHPNTDLNDLKSLSPWYDKLKQHPNGIVNKLHGHDTVNDNQYVYHHGNQREALMTYQQVFQAAIDNLKYFQKDQTEILETVNYLLSHDNQTKITNNWYGIISYGLLQSPYAEHFYNQFCEVDAIINELQSDIHDTATMNDVDLYDDDDMVDYGPEFQGYDENDIAELKASIDRYEKFMATKHDYVYRGKRPATVNDIIMYLKTWQPNM